jgi:hypothetical protein
MELVVNATPRPLYPRERPGTYGIVGLLGPVGVEISLPPGFDTRPVQPSCMNTHIIQYAIRSKLESICVCGPVGQTAE